MIVQFFEPHQFLAVELDCGKGMITPLFEEMRIRNALLMSRERIERMQRGTLSKRDIRKTSWQEEVAEYFDIDPDLLERAIPDRRISHEEESEDLKAAVKTIGESFMFQADIALYEKVRYADPDSLSDEERSSQWKNYIFLCLTGERNGFGRMVFYDQIIDAVIKPLLRDKGEISVLDYGCGPSVLTRLIAQDFGDQVNTLSCDVCTFAVDFSVARNQLYNSKARGIVIEDVSSAVELADMDVVLAYTVFEHLPNSTKQIRGLIDCLSPDGVLIENYAGHSSEVPHKSDTFASYRSRDRNLDLLNERLHLLAGKLPEKSNGVYERDARTRFWSNPSIDSKLSSTLKSSLKKEDSFSKKTYRRMMKILAG